MCNGVYVCVLYNRSPMLLFRAQVGMLVQELTDAWPFLVGHSCFGVGAAADVIRGMPSAVQPRCLRCMCTKCNSDVRACLWFIKSDVDRFLRKHIALFGYLWRPSLSNMRALHVVVSCSFDVPRTELATLMLRAGRLQMRYRWHGKRVLERWFRVIAWRRRAWIRVTFVHRVPSECCTVIGAMLFAPPRRRIFRH